MNDLDDELRGILRRGDPPDGFAQRVLLEVAAKREGRPRRSMSWVLGCVAASLILSVGIPFSAFEYRRERERRVVAGLAAKQQLLLAMRVASRKLNSAQRKVYEISLGENR